MKQTRNKALHAAIPGAIAGFLFSGLMGYFVTPFPKTLALYALSCGISGLISGFAGGFMGILLQKNPTK